MRRAVLTPLVVICLSLASGPSSPGERVDDRYGDRTKAAKARDARAQEVEFSGLTRHFPTGSRLPGIDSPVANKAEALVSVAAKQQGDVAVTTLHRVIRMDLPSNARTDRIHSTAYRMLADLYEGKPSKQVVSLGVALQYTTDAATRARIQSRIRDLGGDAFGVQLNSTTTFATMEPGPDDSCVGAVAVSLPHSETMGIFPAGDHNWRSFDVTGTGAVILAETVSDFPGSGTDDTDLGLWDDCGGTLLAFNDDTGTDFTSRLTSDCLCPGTYYVEVGGFFDSVTADNFDLDISVVETCVPPAPDSFEPDDDRADAGGIGLPTATSGNGWGRVRKEIQARSIWPAGDRDYARLDLTQNSLVRVGTRSQWPTFFNGFEGSCTGPDCNPDTILTLYWENEPDYGGRCNQPDLRYLPLCRTDADCPDPLDNPLPDFPPCILYTMFGFTNPSPFAVNDDRGGGDFGSELLLCLPRTQPGTGSATNQAFPGGFLVEVTAFSTEDEFDYELNVKNEVGCLFEQEPNDTVQTAMPYEIGTTVSGFFDFVTSNPYQDEDYYRFDVAETTSVFFEALTPYELWPEAALYLAVGPDDDGEYYETGPSYEDCDGCPVHWFAVTLPNASALLGNMTNDADYYLNVTSNYFNPNYYYDFHSAVLTPAAPESEPNDDVPTADSIDLGGTFAGELTAGCDVDTVRFELAAPTFVRLDSVGGDSAIRLIDCDSGARLACDDDSGGRLQPSITGCLPAGSYCAQIRAFSGADEFDYEVRLEGTGGCAPLEPPALSGDDAFSCLDFASCL